MEGEIVMSMRQFADHVIAVAKKSGKRISNLQLQKIMYFAIGDYIIKNGITARLSRMYDEPFEAWPYGPVIRSEYFRYKKYGSFPIRNDGKYIEDYKCFDTDIKKYIDENVNRLVERSHDHETWWRNSEKILRNIVVKYELEDLENDFTHTEARAR